MAAELKMAWRNLWRNPRRTLLTIAAISFAGIILVFMLSFQLGSYDVMINTSVKTSTGHLQVQAKDYLDDKEMRKVIKDPRKVASILADMEGIEGFTLRANGFCLVSSSKRTQGVLLTGIDPGKEARVSTLKSLVRKGAYLGDKASYEVLVGELLAQNMKVGVGDELTILGQGLDGSVAAAVLVVKGIFKSGLTEMDRNTALMPLSGFQEIFSMGESVHRAVVLVDSLLRVDSVKQAVQTQLRESADGDDLVVLDWMEIMPGLLQGIEMDLVSGLIMYAVLIIVVAFSIFNTFLMAVFERTREFGVLLAVGTTPGRLTRLVLLESVCMTLIGIGIGIIAGSLVTLYFQTHGIYISGAEEMLKEYGLPSRLYPRLSIVSAATGPLVVFLITVISAVFPALKIRRIEPVKAMHHA